jgi:glycosyltransferase involved in cell wall biosynthesis
MVGPAAAHKNIAPVADALARRGIAVVVVGGAGSHPVFAATSPSAGGPSHDEPPTTPGTIFRVGHVSDGEVSWLYQHAGVLVFPSLYEGFGLPVVEAQTFGLPVVASQRASLPEVAGAGAVLVDPTDPDDVAVAAERVLSDPALASRLAQAGRHNVQRFTWESSARVVAGTLHDLLHDG